MKKWMYGSVITIIIAVVMAVFFRCTWILSPSFPAGSGTVVGPAWDSSYLGCYEYESRGYSIEIRGPEEGEHIGTLHGIIRMGSSERSFSGQVNGERTAALTIDIGDGVDYSATIRAGDPLILDLVRVTDHSTLPASAMLIQVPCEPD